MLTGITSSLFGLLNNEQISLYTLTNQQGDIVRLINYGASLVSWISPDQHGNRSDIILGFDTLEQYIDQPYYAGAIIGRCANLIDQGQVRLDRSSFQLSRNFGKHHLHGGNAGFDKKIWSAAIADPHIPTIQFNYLSPGQEEGYPGNLQVAVIYSLSDSNELTIDYKATCDQPTIINLTNHAYFNLTGDFGRKIDDHYLQVNADHYTETGPDKLPTGDILPVTGSIYDYRRSKLLKPGSVNSNGYNVNYVLSEFNGQTRHIVSLAEKVSGRELNISSNQPGLQLFTANHFDGRKRDRFQKALHKHAALCLEPQFFPGTPSFPHFPSVVLRPGDTYHHISIYSLKAIAE